MAGSHNIMGPPEGVFDKFFKIPVSGGQRAMIPYARRFLRQSVYAARSTEPRPSSLPLLRPQIRFIATNKGEPIMEMRAPLSKRALMFAQQTLPILTIIGGIALAFTAPIYGYAALA